ncbi:MAG: hypothetical protein Kow0047_18310 [Anaerolineae bacterium]
MLGQTRMLRDHPLLASAIYLGITVLASIGIPLWLGVTWDRRLGSYPWLTVAGILAGTLFASASIWRIVRKRYDRLAPRQEGVEEP